MKKIAPMLALCAFASLASAADWYVGAGGLGSINDALAVAVNGDTIIVGPGDHAGVALNKAVTIKGTGGARITSGPAHGSGMSQGFRLMAGSTGATLSHLIFTTDLAIMNGDAVDDVTVTQCTFLNAVQAVSNWRGCGWDISHNKIEDLRTRNGGGIGILIADYSARPLGIKDNVVSHNTISGTLHVMAGDGGGYSGTGVVLYADFRWGGLGAEAITNNRVVKNKVSLVSDNPTVVDVLAFELTDTRDDVNEDIIYDNAIGFNDFRGTAQQIALTPYDLDTMNTLSRNLGENRGQGAHPSFFK